MDLDKILVDVLDYSIHPDDFSKLLRELSDNVSRFGFRYFATSIDPVNFYRARVFNSIDQLPKKVSGFSYPPLEINSIGRANIQGESIFYASSDLPTTFVEMKDSILKDTIVAVAEWRTVKEFRLQRIGYLDIKSNLHEKYENLLNKIYTFQGTEYYNYSAVIAKHLMSGDTIAGITYPCIITNDQCENFALKADYVNKHLHLVNITVYRVKDIKPNFDFKAEQIDFAVPIGDDLCYKGRPKMWVPKKGGELQKIWNGWEWDAYDENGELVEPE
jgi:hypothetical protein